MNEHSLNAKYESAQRTNPERTNDNPISLERSMGSINLDTSRLLNELDQLDPSLKLERTVENGDELANITSVSLPSGERIEHVASRETDNDFTIIDLPHDGDSDMVLITQRPTVHVDLNGVAITDMEQAQDVEKLIGFVTQDIIQASKASMSPSWRQRSIDSEHGAPSSQVAYIQEGNIGADGYQHGYKVDSIPVAFPLNTESKDTILYRDISDMTTEEKDMYGVDRSVDNGTTPFQNLDPATKQSLLTARILELESISQNVEARTAAMKENIKRTERGIIAEQTDYLHGFSAKHIKDLLNEGLVAGELKGSRYDQGPSLDTYPYNLDLWDGKGVGAINPDGTLNVVDEVNKWGECIAIVDRSKNSTDKDNEVSFEDGEGMHGSHRVIFGGVPSTEVRGVYMQPIPKDTNEYMRAAIEPLQRENLSNIKNTIVAEGFYIPVYDSDGTLALSYDEYKIRRDNSDYNEAKTAIEITTQSATEGTTETELTVPDLPFGGSF